MENKNTQPNKPFALVKKELQESIVNSINESGVPLEIVQYIIKDLYEQISATVTQQENNEIAAYEAKLAELKDKE